MTSAALHLKAAGLMRGAGGPISTPSEDRRSQGRPTGTAGYTLIEAILVCLVVGVIIALGASSFIHLIPKYRLHGAVWEVSAKLNEARYTAVLKNAPVRVRFTGSGYCLEQQHGEDGSWLRLSGRRLEGVSLRANNAPIFHPQGTVSNLATIWVENGWGRYKITLAITGRIKATKG